MSSHFKWYPTGEEATVPWNARYSFPSQANKAIKITPRIPPKNGMTFTPGNVIRVEFPAQGYVNPANTHLSFDVILSEGVGAIGNSVRFQNNIQSIFSRVRLLYGSTPLEDMIDYNQIVRNLTEWTATAGTNIDQTSIAEGLGGITFGNKGNYTVSGVTPPAYTPGIPGLLNTRLDYIQGYDFNASGVMSSGSQTPNGLGTAPYSIRRYQIQFALGLFTQKKLIPTKFMASQLAIEITLAAPANCMFCTMTGDPFNYNTSFTPPILLPIAGTPFTTLPSYSITNVNLIPEILEFDASYDANFIRGLREGGVPIKFSSWHTFQFSSSNTLNCLIQERSRSVKSLIAVCRRNQGNAYADSGATLFVPTPDTTLIQYQYRCGGRYFPASPVQTSTNSISGQPMSNGGAEAFVELQKVLNTVGDYRLQTGVNTLRWGYPVGVVTGVAGSDVSVVNDGEKDYTETVDYFNGTGTIITKAAYTNVSSFAGNVGSSCFAMATSMETSNGIEISGLNAEEQSDISLQATYSTGAFSANTAAAYNIEVFTYYDAMLVLKENNVIELIQ